MSLTERRITVVLVIVLILAADCDADRKDSKENVSIEVAAHQTQKTFGSGFFLILALKVMDKFAELFGFKPELDELIRMVSTVLTTIHNRFYKKNANNSIQQASS